MKTFVPSGNIVCLGSSSGQEAGDTIEELRNFKRQPELSPLQSKLLTVRLIPMRITSHPESLIPRWIAEILTDYVPPSIVTGQTRQTLNGLLMRAKEKLPTRIPHEFIEIVYSSDQTKLAILHENLHICLHHIRDHHTMQRRALSIG